MTKGLVTVIIPTYKRPTKLERAIDSVLKQSYQKIEIIVVDDNNEGDKFRKETKSLMEKYTNNDKVVYLKHKLNKNGSAARNTGIRQAKGEYVAFLDDDDFFHKNKVLKQVDFLESNLEKEGVVTLHQKSFKNIIYKKNSIDKKSDLFFGLFSGKFDFAAGSTILMYTKVLKELNGFNEEFIRHQDLELLIRFFRSFKLGVVEESLVTITVDGHRNYPSAEKFEMNKFFFLDSFKEDFNKQQLEKKELIYQYQLKEVLTYHFVEFNMEKIKSTIKSIKRKKGKLNLLFWCKCIYMFFEKRLPFLQVFKYRVGSLFLK